MFFSHRIYNRQCEERMEKESGFEIVDIMRHIFLSDVLQTGP